MSLRLQEEGGLITLSSVAVKTGELAGSNAGVDEAGSSNLYTRR